MKIVAFLGNPGNTYKMTRHNAGFLIGSHFSERHNISVQKKAFSAFSGVGRVGVSDLFVLFPQTFMNLSGQSVSAAFSFYKEDAQSLIVVHDEIEIEFGDIRKKNGGGHKGHNGLRSIMQQIGTGDFERLRFGVGRPPDDAIDVASYVLSPFSADERSKLPILLDRACDELEGML